MNALIKELNRIIANAINEGIQKDKTIQKLINKLLWCPFRSWEEMLPTEVYVIKTYSSRHPELLYYIDELRTWSYTKDDIKSFFIVPRYN